MAQLLKSTRSLSLESSASPSMIQGLGITTSPQNNLTSDPPIAEDHKLLAQLTMLPEDVEVAAQEEVSFAFPVIVPLAKGRLMSTHRLLISGPCSQSWRVRRVCIAIVYHRRCWRC